MSTWRRRWLVVSPWTLSTYATDEAGAIPTKVLDLHAAAFVKRDEDRYCWSKRTTASMCSSCRTRYTSLHERQIAASLNGTCGRRMSWMSGLARCCLRRAATSTHPRPQTVRPPWPDPSPREQRSWARVPELSSMSEAHSAPIAAAGAAAGRVGGEGRYVGTFHRRWAVLRRWSLATHKSDEAEAQPTKGCEPARRTRLLWYAESWCGCAAISVCMPLPGVF